MPSPLRRHIAPLLFFFILAGAFCGDVLFSEKAFSGFDVVLWQSERWDNEIPDIGVHQPLLLDSPTAHYPERQFKWSIKKNLGSANYNPLVFSGIPFGDQGVGALVTSFFQFFLPVPEAIDFSTWFRLGLAGFLMYLFLVSLSLTTGAALFGGVVWAFNLHQIAWLEFPQHLATQLWIPFVFMASWLFIRRGFSSYRAALLVLANLLFFTGGYTQIVLYTYLALGLFNTAAVFQHTALSWIDRVKRWVGVNGFFLLAGLILLPQVLVQSEDIAIGLRSLQGFRSGLVELESFPTMIINTFANFFPNLEDAKRLLSGSYYGGVLGRNFHGPDGSRNPIEFLAFGGSLTVVFVLYGLVSRFVVNGEVVKRLPWIMVLALFFSLLHNDQLVLHLLNILPYFGFGAYGRAITLLLFSFSILAAIGFAAFLKDYSTKERFSWKYPATLMAFVLVGLGCLINQVDLRFESFKPIGIALSVLLLLALLMPRIGIIRITAPALLIGLTVFELFRFGYGFNTRLDDQFVFPTNEMIRQLRLDQSDFRVSVRGETPVYHPNVLSYYGIPEVGGYSTVAPNNYITYIREVFGRHHVTANGILFLFDGNWSALRLLNTKYILSDKELDDERLKGGEKVSRLYLYEFTDPLERVFCGSAKIEVPEQNQVTSKLASLLAKYDKPIVVEGDNASVRLLPDDCTTFNIKVYTNSLEFDVRSSEESVVFIPYNFSKHWEVTIDGRGSKVERANYSFMALTVPAGVHRVELGYNNHLSVVGYIVLILSALLILVIALMERERERGVAWVVFLASVVVLFSLTSLPGIYDEKIPEKILRLQDRS